MNSKNSRIENRTDCDAVRPKEEDFIEIVIPYDLFQYLSSDECNIQSVCRICLTTNSETMYPLYTTEKTVLLNMFMALTSIQVYLEDGLPSNICASCQTEILHFYEFKTRCEKSDYILKSVLKGEFVNKEEPPVSNVASIQGPVTENEINTQIKVESHLKVKVERDLNEENEELNVEYLEDLNDIVNGDKPLCIVQNTAKRKRKPKALNSNVPDPKRRQKQVSRKKYHMCTFCSKKFHKAKTLRAHISTHHTTSMLPYICEQCKVSFSTEHDLFLHLSEHSKGPPWSCIKCHKEFQTKSMVRRHIQRHMESKRYACDTCGKTFSELYALRRHIRVHTGETIEKKHACHICDKRYASRTLLSSHVTRHSGVRPYICSACGKDFPSPRLLASHRLVHTDNKPHACRYCDKRFRHESTLNTHHRTHTGEKPYVCSVCGKTFIQNSNLTLHMRTHTGEKPYSCSICGRRFSSGSALKGHERTHSADRSYSCTVCGKKFNFKNLKAHMRVHTSARSHECNLCPKKFSSQSRLRDHCRLHTGERPFECAACSRKFPTKSYLIKHVKTHDQPKKIKNRGVFIVRRKPNVMYLEHDNNLDNTECHTSEKDITLGAIQEIPLEVTGELILQDDSNIKTELIVVDNSENLTNSDVNFVGNDINYGNDVNLVTVNEGEVSISASGAALEGATVKLYQLDQSLLQIHTAGGQLTISKITSKMTANF